MIEMASGDPVDGQREKRWPDHTEQPGAQSGPGGLQVHFQPHEEDSDVRNNTVHAGLVAHKCTIFMFSTRI
jgi:hypothetical protein